MTIRAVKESLASRAFRTELANFLLHMNNAIMQIRLNGLLTSQAPLEASRGTEPKNTPQQQIAARNERRNTIACTHRGKVESAINLGEIRIETPVRNSRRHL